MKLTKLIFEHWVSWVRFQSSTAVENNDLSWRGGWQVNFWYILNMEWVYMNRPDQTKLRESESCWDPYSEKI